MKINVTGNSRYGLDLPPKLMLKDAGKILFKINIDSNIEEPINIFFS